MAYPSYTYTLTNGTTADASQVMQNLNDILNGVTDGTKDLSIAALTVAGTATLNGNVAIGNASGDDLTVTASLASSIPLKTDASYDIGSTSIGLRALFFGANSQRVKVQASSSASASWTLTLPVSAGTANYLMKTDGSGNTAWLSITDSALFATGSLAGTVSAADQTFAGRKSAGNSKISVYRATDQAITSGSSTKISFNTELFDTNTEFDSATNYRFTPSRTGYYQVCVQAMLQVSAAGTYTNIEVKKGAGATRVMLGSVENGGTRDTTVVMSKLLYLTATTDYLEFFIEHNHGSNRNLYGGADFNFLTITEVL